MRRKHRFYAALMQSLEQHNKTVLYLPILDSVVSIDTGSLPRDVATNEAITLKLYEAYHQRPTINDVVAPYLNALLASKKYVKYHPIEQYVIIDMVPMELDLDKYEELYDDR